MQSSHVPSTVLERSTHQLTQCSHRVLSGRFCDLRFTGEETKALRGGVLCLGSLLMLTPEQLEEVVNLDESPASLLITLSQSQRVHLGSRKNEA